MSVDPSTPPTALQALLGVALWIGFAAVFIVFMADEPLGNRVFLGILAALCAGYGVWRSVWLVRAIRQNR